MIIYKVLEQASKTEFWSHLFRRWRSLSGLSLIAEHSVAVFVLFLPLRTTWCQDSSFTVCLTGMHFEAHSLGPAITALEPTGSTGSVNTLLLVCGWWGAKLPQVENFTRLLVTQIPQCAAVCFCPPVASLRGFPSPAMKPFVERMLCSVAQSGMETKVRNIILLALSNCGAAFYQNLATSEFLSDSRFSNIFAKLKGVILDSGPGVLNAVSCAKAVVAMMHPQVPARITLTRALVVLFGLFFALRFAMAWVSAALARKPTAHDKTCAWWLARGLPAPQVLPVPELFIYGEADQICRARDIAALVARRREEGGRVTELLMDGEHVQHIIADPKRYISAVLSFVENLRC